MKDGKQGKLFKLKCTGKADGTRFVNSNEKDPLEFNKGQNEIMPAIENQVIHMKIGEQKSFKVPPDNAFGVKKPDLVKKVKKSHFPKNVAVEVGKELQVQKKDGTTQNFRIIEIENEIVTIDFNHPLAGQTLEFDIKVLDIQ